MNRKTVKFALVSLLWIVAATGNSQGLQAASPAAGASAPAGTAPPGARVETSTALRGGEKAAIAASSVKKGDPAPGNAMTLSVPQARNMLKAAIRKKYVGTMKSCQRVLMVKGCATSILSVATDVRVRASGFDFAAPYTYQINAGPLNNNAGKVSVNFNKAGPNTKVAGGEIDAADYIQAYLLGSSHSKVTWSPTPLYSVGFLPSPGGSGMDVSIFVWSDEAAAQEFADAFNRLLYAAYHDEEFVTFSAAAKAWRDNPVKPPLTPEADRHRILAENAIQEKKFDSAIGHYESAVEVQPMWPAFWFNLGMLYAEQKDFATAVDRMKRYLELVPDAPDAQAARTKMIIWEDEASQSED